MKKKISTAVIFGIWVAYIAITFAMSRDGVLGELWRDPYNYDKVDVWLIAGVVGLVPIVLGVLYVIFWVWVIRPIAKYFD